ncbi:MAG: GatB/YqeY domain-containing protein [Paracoccaceae bacterium]
MLRTRLGSAMKEAMKAKEKTRLATLRLILAAIKDRDIASRTDDGSEGVSDEEILAILSKMVRQRQESAKAYDEAGRLELAEEERAEIRVIEEFLPSQLSDEEMNKAINEEIRETGAKSIRDMGRVMGGLKAKYAGRMDFGKAGAAVKSALG